MTTNSTYRKHPIRAVGLLSKGLLLCFMGCEFDGAGKNPESSQAESLHICDNALFAMHSESALQARPDPSGDTEERPPDGAPIVQTVLVVYTPGAAAVAETHSRDIATHTAEIIEVTNEIYEVSGINVKLELADVRLLGYSFSDAVATAYSGPEGALYPPSLYPVLALIDPNDGAADELHAWRDEVSADFVVLKKDGCGGAAGIPWSALLTDAMQGADFEPAFALAGHAASTGECTGNLYPVAHELGHLQGCAHQPGSNVLTPGAPYAQGYVGPNFRTIMGAMTTEPRVPIFSGPDNAWLGMPAGSHRQNCAAQINKTAVERSLMK